MGQLYHSFQGWGIFRDIKNVRAREWGRHAEKQNKTKQNKTKQQQQKKKPNNFWP